MISSDSNRHPCFSSCAKGKYGRIHLPVAPDCNIKCNYCNRRHDCVNESRPGVASMILKPKEAVKYLGLALQEEPRISVAGIAGPGDPFATPERTLETLQLVRAAYPHLILCLSSNGLNVSNYIDDLAALEVNYMTITINAVDPDIGAKIYQRLNLGTICYMAKDAARILLPAQLKTIERLKKRNISIKVNTVVIPGLNDNHVLAIARQVAELGVDLMNCISMIPVEGTPFAHIKSMSRKDLNTIRDLASQYLPQMRHCTRCRADAVGMLGADKFRNLTTKMDQFKE